jgi:hypothetical protein
VCVLHKSLEQQLRVCQASWDRVNIAQPLLIAKCTCEMVLYMLYQLIDSHNSSTCEDVVLALSLLILPPTVILSLLL